MTGGGNTAPPITCCPQSRGTPPQKTTKRVQPAVFDGSPPPPPSVRVSNVPLWEQLLAALDENPRTVHWVKVPSHVTIEGNNEADRLADQGRQLHPRFPHPRTPSLLLSVAGTPRAPKKLKLLTLDSSPLPVKRLNFGAQALPPLIHSIEGQAVLTTLNLTLMADVLSTTSDISHCDTDSWSAESTDSASQLSSRTCSTEGSRD